MAKASAIISYIKRIFQSKKKSDNDSLNSFGVKWFDGEESDKPSEEETPLPMFIPGLDEVVMYNPYLGAFMVEDDFGEMEPERYLISDVAYDEDEKVFRYLLDDVDLTDVWYSEDWLSLPTVTQFAKWAPPEDKATEDTEYNPMEEVTVKMSEIEDAILTKALDDELKGREIDRFLDMLREGDAEEREAAEKELRKLTGGVAE